MLLDKAQLSEGQALNCFLAGLRHDVEVSVRMFNPKTLQEAYALAKLQESLKNDLHMSNQRDVNGGYSKYQGGSGVGKMVTTSLPSSSEGSEVSSKGLIPSTFVNRPLNLTPKQMEEKRLKN